MGATASLDGHGLTCHHSRREKATAINRFDINVGSPFGRRSLLITLGVALLCLSVLLVLGWCFTNKADVSLTSDLTQNVLTYLPTAFMVVLVAAWRQVDYSCKISAPWIELSQGHVSAPKSVMLDYVSSFQLFSFYSSIKNRHVAVACAILGFVILKGATIASTGLLVLEMKSQTYSKTIEVTAPFNGSLYNPTNLSLLQDQLPVFTAYGILANGLHYPLGTAADAAYTPFRFLQAVQQNSSFITELGAIFPVIDCKPADVSIDLLPANLTVNIQNPQHQINLHSSTCDNKPGPILALNPAKFSCPKRQLSGTIYSVNCGAGNGTWRLITMTDMRYEQTLNESQKVGPQGEVDAFESSTKVANVTSSLCRISYTIGQLNVSGNGDTFPTRLNASSILPNNTTKKLENFTDSGLDSMINGAVSAAQNIFSVSDGTSYLEEVPDTMLKLLASQAGGSYAALLDAQTLKSTAEVAYTHVAVQSMSRYLTSPDFVTSNAIILETKEAIVVTSLSTWLMICSFLVTASIGVALLLLGGTRVPKIHAETLEDMSEVASKSTSLWPLLRLTREQSEKDVACSLRSYAFKTTLDRVEDTFAITAIPSKQCEDDVTVGHKHSSVWWKQVTLSYWFLGLTFVYAVVVVIVLETLQRLSDARKGFAAVNFEGGFGRTMVSHYLPTLVMILLGTMFNCLDFNVLLLHPFHSLKSGESISFLRHRPPVGQPAFVSFWNALVKLNYGILGSSAAAFAGALLTIVVSGLYTIDKVEMQFEGELQAMDIVSAVWDESVSDDGGAAIITSLTDNFHLSYPSGAYEEIAFQHLSVPGVSQDYNLNDDFITEASIAGFRSALICDTAAVGEYNVTVLNTTIEHVATISTVYPLPSNCMRGGSDGNSSELSFSHEFRIPINSTDSYIGKLLDLHVGPYYDENFGQSSDELFPQDNPNNPAGCPSLGLIYGYLSQDDLSQSIPPAYSVAVQVCYQQMARFEANVTFQGHNMTISDTRPPLIINGTSRNLTVPGTNETAFQFRVQTHFDNALSFFNNTNNTFDSFTGSRIVDRFFQGVMFGRQPLPIDTMKLLTEADFDTLQLGIEAFYRRYMAQAISAKMRLSATGLTKADLAAHVDELKYPAMIVRGVTQERLVQHNTSKVILQCVIGVMILGGVVAVTTTQLMNLLPACANPCTIWGQLSLWSDSQWCMQMQSKLQSKETSESSRVNLLNLKAAALNKNESEKLVFRLGWWTTDGVAGRESRYGIDQEA